MDKRQGKNQTYLDFCCKLAWELIDNAFEGGGGSCGREEEDATQQPQTFECTDTCKVF